MLPARNHNNPPGPIDFAKEATDDLAVFLLSNPVILNPGQVKDGTLLVERTRKTLQDLEDARKAETGPLNEQVRAINERYKPVRSSLDAVLDELRRRLTDYTARLEAARIKEAEEKRNAALALEMEARRAEEAEREAKENATLGEVTDVAAAIHHADNTFNDFAKADRAAQIAESQTHVRLPSQLGGRALSMRTKEELIVDDLGLAFTALGSFPVIHDAILTAARAYRKAYGKLPPGVRAEYTRSI